MSALQYSVAVVAAVPISSEMTNWAAGTQKPRSEGVCLGFWDGALGGIRTPNLLIRSQMLYPLSYERWAPVGDR